MGKWGERKERVCLICGAVDYVKPSDQSKYCSKECRTKAKMQPDVVCMHCGKSFHPKNNGGNKKMFCSRECSFAFKTNRSEQKKIKAALDHTASLNKVCSVCGKEFVAENVNQKICSDECHKELARVYSYNRSKGSKVITEHICKHCGKSFKAEYGDKKREFCSYSCGRRFAHKVEDKNHRRRARRFGVAYQPINKLKVFERDGWTCQICGRKTPKKLLGSINLKAPELDHRVPISKGGGHTLNNVQCACRRCNINKGNRTNAGQMRLFG